MRSIRWKLVIMYVALIFIVLILTGTFIILSYRQQEESKAENDLKQYAVAIRDNIINEYVEPEYFQEGFESPTFSIGSRFQGNILNHEGATIATSEIPLDGNFPRHQSSVIIAASNGEESFVAGRKHPDSNDKMTTWMEYACPVFATGGGGIEYIIYVRINADSIYATISDTTNILVLSIIAALVLTCILGVFFSGTLTGPISILTSKAKELAEGNLDLRIEAASKDEIGQLTESFNYMASELKKTMSEMESDKNKLEIILYNMTDGVLAFDSAGTLIHANQVSEELLGVKNINSMNFTKLSGILYPDETFDVENIDSYDDVTVSIGGRFISAAINTYRSAHGELEGTIIVLQDITRHRQLDDMRKEFVANVSHEIRTPLTNIKSYAETLIDGAMNDKELATDFLEVINGEVDRMTHIVRDLLELSSLDNKQLALDLESSDINELIRMTVKQHSITAKKFNKEIRYEDESAPVYLMIDTQRIAQVLTNIITNSLKYSYDGALVEIWMERSRQYTRVFVRDNGMGIPKEDLRNIFDRFYRVDKARSRALGGTGLGLSIAKEIMEAHGGGISAISELSKGTTMILRFPNNSNASANTAKESLVIRNEDKNI